MLVVNDVDAVVEIRVVFKLFRQLGKVFQLFKAVVYCREHDLTHVVGICNAKLIYVLFGKRSDVWYFADIEVAKYNVVF